MKNSLLVLACILVAIISVVLVPFPDGVVAVFLVVMLSLFSIFMFRRATDEKEFVTSVFLIALVLRMSFGLLVHVFELRDFFGGDADLYHGNGVGMADVWLGHSKMTEYLAYQNTHGSGAGWGMNYFVAIIYLLVGPNMFAAQSICAVIGAATAPMVFFCSKKIFNNVSVSKMSAIAIAVFPSFVIWSGQLLKDGLVVFLLVLAMTMILQIQVKWGYGSFVLLILSLFGILSLRFYIFYMVMVAVVGSFLVGMSSSTRSILRTTIVLALIGASLGVLGVGEKADVDLRTFGNLERVQVTRLDLSRAGTGFAENADVSQGGGALSVIPIGFAYLMFAPFPWQATNLRQAITIPEVLVWWAMLPLLVIGLNYTIRNRLRNAFPILIFSLLLTLAYSISQGNVGTAYRQRTQIQVFLFILIGVGWTVFQEQRENKRVMRTATRKRVDSQLRASV